MAAILSVFGGTAGFLAAIVALAIFGAPLLTALFIWVGTGCTFVIVGLLRALVPHAQHTRHSTQEPA